MRYLDLAHLNLKDIATFRSRSEALEAARTFQSGAKSVVQSSSVWGRVWVLRCTSPWNSKTNVLRLMGESGEWVERPVAPRSGEYRSPLHGRVDEWLQQIECDYPEGSASRSLEVMVTALLMEGIAVRTRADYAKRSNHLSLEQIEAVLVPATSRIARRWGISGGDIYLPARVLEAIEEELTDGTPGHRMARFLLLVLNEAARSRSWAGIDFIETAAAETLTPQPVTEDA